MSASHPAISAHDNTCMDSHVIRSEESAVRYYDDVLRYCRRMGQDTDTASDVVQETYQRFLSAQQAGQRVLQPKALLLRIARHLLIDLSRRNGVRQHVCIDGLSDADMPSALQAGPEEALASMQIIRAYIETIEGLPARCREAFILHVFDDMPYAQIALAMGISYSMVEKHIARGIIACKLCERQLAAGIRTASSLPG